MNDMLQASKSSYKMQCTTSDERTLERIRMFNYLFRYPYVLLRFTVCVCLHLRSGGAEGEDHTSVAEALNEARNNLDYVSVLHSRTKWAVRALNARLGVTQLQIERLQGHVFASHASTWLEKISFPLFDPKDLGNADDHFLEKVQNQMMKLMYVLHSHSAIAQ